MKLRFWQKTYVLTLILFLLCLYAGLFSLAFYTYDKNVKNLEELCRSEQSYVAASFERDHEDMLSAGSASSPSLLMDSYGRFYLSEGVKLEFFKNGKSVYSSFSDPVSAPQAGTLSQERISGRRFVLISTEICGGEYLMLYGRDASELDAEFGSLMTTYAIVAAAVSVILAILLLIVLKKLSVPLEKLKGTTEAISNGDMTVAADESGKDEFASLAKSFNRMVSKVKSQMYELEEDAKTKQTLVDDMAHEMRTPLTSIRGYAEYIEKAAVPEEEKSDAARRIVSEADRLKRISEKLLDAALIRENGIEKRKVDLADVLRDTAERLSAKADKKGVKIETELSAAEVDGDETLLSMLFYNLTENAIKACAEGGRIVLYSSGKTAIVSDDGKGMTEEQLGHVTEPFYRTDKSRSRAEGGAGLGLALCARIADSHGAKMTFLSEPGKGTEVRVEF
ncbi:MAG: HAMP domain-containing histidine kinase [Clostridia bacterium]|nr:HAMP domain-containing histidine kinase [Clostridia bacterium]